MWPPRPSRHESLFSKHFCPAAEVVRNTQRTLSRRAVFQISQFPSETVFCPFLRLSCYRVGPGCFQKSQVHLLSVSPVPRLPFTLAKSKGKRPAPFQSHVQKFREKPCSGNQLRETEVRRTSVGSSGKTVLGNPGKLWKGIERNEKGGG